MKYLALLLALLFTAGCSGCASVPAPTVADLQRMAARLEFRGGVICSGIAVAADQVATATHCFGQGPLEKVNGQPVSVMRVSDDKRDHATVILAQPMFKHWAKRGKPMKVGDHVRWIGQPNGEPFVYREGVVSKVGEGYVLLDATTCHGDSGAGLLNDRGELVGSITGMTNEFGCTFMGVLR